jgi:GTP cyclohydrolase I
MGFETRPGVEFPGSGTRLARRLPVMESRLRDVHEVEPAAAPRELNAGQRARFERYLAEMLRALGMPLDTDGTRGTPARLLEAWLDSTAGYVADPKLVTTFPRDCAPGEEGIHDQVVEGPIPFTALCEHHALPFFGNAWVGYVAGERLIGLSKLTRLVRQYSRRFTMQERLGRDVAGELQAIVGAQGAAVCIEAVHLCTRMRGVRETEALTRSTTWHGSYALSAALRQEFLALCAAR